MGLSLSASDDGSTPTCSSGGSEGGGSEGGGSDSSGDDGSDGDGSDGDGSGGDSSDGESSDGDSSDDGTRAGSQGGLQEGHHAADGVLAVRLSHGVGLGDPARKGAKLYLVKWCGLPEAEATWEPAAHITHALLAEAVPLPMLDGRAASSVTAQARPCPTVVAVSKADARRQAVDLDVDLLIYLFIFILYYKQKEPAIEASLYVCGAGTSDPSLLSAPSREPPPMRCRYD